MTEKTFRIRVVVDEVTYHDDEAPPTYTEIVSTSTYRAFDAVELWHSRMSHSVVARELECALYEACGMKTAKAIVDAVFSR